MTEHGLVKKICSGAGCGLFAVLLCVFAPAVLHAESVFLKDGLIVDGKIAKESDDKIAIEMADKTRHDYLRKDIIRILYHGDFKDLRYLTKMDGTVLQVYLVDENRASYTYRLDLNSAEEVIILKDEVDSISKRKVVIAKVPEKKPEGKKDTSESTMLTTAPLLRVASNFGAGSSVTGYAKEWASPFEGLCADLFLYRARSSSGNGIDFFIRGSHNEYHVTNAEKIGYTTPAGYALEDNSSSLRQNSIGAGVRLVYGAMLGGFLWQAYVLGYYQYSSVDVELKYRYTGVTAGGSGGGYTYNYKSHGLVGGIGFEVALFKYMGLFVEYTNGYSPAFAKSASIESGTIHAGATIRTPLL